MHTSAAECQRIFFKDAQSDLQTIAEMPGPQLTLWLQSLFLFSAVWSFGGNTDAAGRGSFNTYLRRLVSNDVPQELAIFATGTPVKISAMMPEAKSVYDYVFDKSKSNWQFWLITVESKPLDPEAEYSNIVVPTVDTIRCALSDLVTSCCARLICESTRCAAHQISNASRLSAVDSSAVEFVLHAARLRQCR